MANNITKIVNTIIPEVFTRSMERKITKKNALISSGIITTNPALNSLISGGGVRVTIPRFNVIGGEAKPLSETRKIERQGLSQNKDVATVLIRGNSFAIGDLASAFSGEDFQNEANSQLADWWLTQDQATFLATLNGVFESQDMTDLILDARSQNISANLILDGKQRLGDMATKLSVMFINSYTFTELQKQDLIQYIKPSTGGQEIMMYQGYRVLVDDDIYFNTENGESDTYLLSTGAFGGGSGTPTALTMLETERDARGGVTDIVSRRAQIIHPSGFEFVGNIANVEDATPSNTDLASGLNWKRTAKRKSVGLVKIKHKVDLPEWYKPETQTQRSKPKENNQNKPDSPILG